MAIGSRIFELVLVPNLSLKQTILIFMDQIYPKISEDHHWIQHIQFSLCTKFQLNQTVWIYWTKFTPEDYFWSKKKWTSEMCTKVHLNNFEFLSQIHPKKGSFRSKTEKVNIITEFSTFELALVPNFKVNKQFWSFRLNLFKKGKNRKQTNKQTTKAEKVNITIKFFNDSPTKKDKVLSN